MVGDRKDVIDLFILLFLNMWFCELGDCIVVFF